jgi:hypothetical protein
MTNPSFFPIRVSEYVPAMQYSADVNYNGATRVSFGSPVVANATLIATALSVAAAATFDLTNVAQFPETYGRNISVIASGAATSPVVINGWDYLGQPISESFTLAGAVAVAGNKAFKTIRNMVVTTTTAATTVNIGSGAKFGLPYKAIRCQFEVANGVLAAAGTLQTASLVDPATATTTDPRGLYTPTTTPNGTTAIDATFDFINDVNAAGRGGLMGLPHFAS